MSGMSLNDILMSHGVVTLRKEVKKANIAGFATMPKEKLIAEMLKRPADLWKHIKPSGRKGRASYVGTKRAPTKTKKDAAALAELRSTKKGRLAIIEDRMRRLPANASPGRLEAIKAQLRAEKRRK